MKVCENITILSANFNNGKFLAEYFDSILRSTLLPKEILVVDDASTDDSKKKLKSYEERDDRIKVIYLDKNIGFGNALNLGISHVNTKLLMRLDTDDIIHPEKIEIQYNEMLRYPEVDILGTNAFYISGGKIIHSSNFPNSFQEIKKCYQRGENGVMHGSIIGKTNAFKRYQYVQENVPVEDYDIFSRMIRGKLQFKNLPNNLLYVRVHRNSVTNSYKFSTTKKIARIQNRVFKNKPNSFTLLTSYLHNFFWRKYLYKGPPVSYIYLALSGVFFPKKILNRLTRGDFIDTFRRH